VDVQHDLVLGGRLDDLAIVVDHELRVVRVAFRRRVGDVSRFYRIDTQRLIEGEGFLHLALVVLNPA
jgi:hypothetical protein